MTQRPLIRRSIIVQRSADQAGQSEAPVLPQRMAVVHRKVDAAKIAAALRAAHDRMDRLFATA